MENDLLYDEDDVIDIHTLIYEVDIEQQEIEITIIDYLDEEEECLLI